MACRGTVAVVFSTLTAALLLTGFARNIPVAPDPSGYHILKTIPVGGTEGWDYLTMDSAARRLYIGRGDHIDVVDVDRGTVVGKVTDLRGAHGMALALDLGRGFTTDGAANTVTIVDLRTLKKIGTVNARKDPDSFAYDDVTKRVFIMNSAGNDATAINASDGTIAGTIALGGQPEFAVADGRGKIFVNITDKDQIVEFDGRTLKITPSVADRSLRFAFRTSDGSEESAPLQSGARTMAVDTKTHNVLLVTAKRGHGSTASTVVPNTFVVLVVGK